LIFLNIFFSIRVFCALRTYPTKTIFLTRQRQLKKSPTPIKTIEFRVFGTRLLINRKTILEEKKKPYALFQRLTKKGNKGPSCVELVAVFNIGLVHFSVHIIPPLSKSCAHKIGSR